jgi:tRNA(Arg) A34 adenosine deaminase TadA
MVPEVRLKLPAWVADQVGDPSRRFDSDREKMALAIALASRNVAEGTGGPFGACVFDGGSGRLVAPGVNVVVPAATSVAHAEAMAILIAQQRLGTHDLAAEGLPPMELFASAQPCIQCYGIVWWSGVRRLVIGARESDVESLTGFQEGALPERWAERLADRPPLPPVEVRTDCLREEAREPLRRYREAEGVIYNPGTA